ncbi:hypothetical protein D3C72_2597150 [compost metagenome]
MSPFFCGSKTKNISAFGCNFAVSIKARSTALILFALNFVVSITGALVSVALSPPKLKVL